MEECNDEKHRRKASRIERLQLSGLWKQIRGRKNATPMKRRPNTSKNTSTFRSMETNLHMLISYVIVVRALKTCRVFCAAQVCKRHICECEQLVSSIGRPTEALFARVDLALASPIVFYGSRHQRKTPVTQTTRIEQTTKRIPAVLALGPKPERMIQHCAAKHQNAVLQKKVSPDLVEVNGQHSHVQMMYKFLGAEFDAKLQDKDQQQHPIAFFFRLQ